MKFNPTPSVQDADIALSPAELEVKGMSRLYTCVLFIYMFRYFVDSILKKENMLRFKPSSIMLGDSLDQQNPII